MIYVVTASHNRKKITTKFANNIKGQDERDVRILLVDDGSTDGTAEAVRAICPDAVILQGSGNLWWGGALHMAYKWLIKNAGVDDYVLISNDDVEYESTYIRRMVAILKENSDTLVSGVGISSESGEIVDLPLIWDYKLFEGNKIQNFSEIGNCASTRSLMLRASDLKRIGGFHPMLLPHYASDYEWTMRAARKGFRIITNEELRYKVYESTTGYRIRKKTSIKKIFSKKSNMNPVYRFNFLILATPVEYWIPAMKSQIKRIKEA